MEKLPNCKYLSIRHGISTHWSCVQFFLIFKEIVLVRIYGIIWSIWIFTCFKFFSKALINWFLLFSFLFWPIWTNCLLELLSYRCKSVLQHLEDSWIPYRHLIQFLIFQTPSTFNIIVFSFSTDLAWSILSWHIEILFISGFTSFPIWRNLFQFGILDFNITLRNSLETTSYEFPLPWFVKKSINTEIGGGIGTLRKRTLVPHIVSPCPSYILIHFKNTIVIKDTASIVLRNKFCIQFITSVNVIVFALIIIIPFLLFYNYWMLLWWVCSTLRSMDQILHFLLQIEKDWTDFYCPHDFLSILLSM